MTAALLLDLIDTRPVDDEASAAALGGVVALAVRSQVLVGNRPVDDDASAAGYLPLLAALAVPSDELTDAVASAMTLFGRCEVRPFVAASPLANGRWVGP